MKSEILVMDCEERGTFWLTLKSDYKILFATTAEEGLEMLSENVGLVFLNMRLPDMKSMEVYRLIRKEYPSTAVIIITACEAEETRAEPIRKEAGDYAKRPLGAEEILLKIKTLVDMDNDSQKRQDMLISAETIQDEQYPDIPSHVVKGILKVRDFVAQNDSESLTLAAACKMASTSKTYFCRFFKDITGHSLRSYHHFVKIRRAEELLRDRRLSVKNVAQKLGYSDANYFSTIYKRVTGISPRQQQAYGRNLARGLHQEKEALGKM
jgi:YesN/AraC family two-component response regulator